MFPVEQSPRDRRLNLFVFGAVITVKHQHRRGATRAFCIAVKVGQGQGIGRGGHGSSLSGVEIGERVNALFDFAARFGDALAQKQVSIFTNRATEIPIVVIERNFPSIKISPRNDGRVRLKIFGILRGDDELVFDGAVRLDRQHLTDFRNHGHAVSPDYVSRETISTG